MKAFIYERYGPPERLRMAEVDQPFPDVGQVLVKVLAASVNAADWHMLRGKPLFSRAALGLVRPKHQILGVIPPEGPAQVLVAPEFIWELGIGIYLIVKGYRTSSPALAGTQDAVV